MDRPERLTDEGPRALRKYAITAHDVLPRLIDELRSSLRERLTDEELRVLGKWARLKTRPKVPLTDYAVTAHRVLPGLIDEVLSLRERLGEGDKVCHIYNTEYDKDGCDCGQFGPSDQREG